MQWIFVEEEHPLASNVTKRFIRGDWMLTSMLLMRMKLLTVVACLLLVPFRGLIEAPFVHGRAFAAVAKLSPVLSQRLVDQFLHAAIGSIALDVCGALNEVYMPHT
ncbi:hypothetical protein H6P81_007096 [Aristolochia fimbriata]|uniref:Uncharacterized protein n=1 Tax=Aristolochia fimbriata TaxID=158543 RepID=A0AAV7EZD4_ARIFI|nr:hypothetical protein H6P81_007096 [Aristolochia fimbriata]